jgi:hypothetical protein
MLLYFHNPSANPFIEDLLAFRYADTVLINDRFGYNRKGYTHRLKIRSEWLAFPTQSQKVKGQILSNKLKYDQKFAYNLRQELVNHYGKETYFDYYLAEVEALIIDTLRMEKSLIYAVWDIANNLMKLAEWPLCPQIEWISHVTEDKELETKEISTLPILQSYQVIEILHDHKSRNVQRQSDKTTKLNSSIENFLSKKFNLSLSDGLFDLLFKYGGYHNLTPWPNKSTIL